MYSRVNVGNEVATFLPLDRRGSSGVFGIGLDGLVSLLHNTWQSATRVNHPVIWSTGLTVILGAGHCVKVDLRVLQSPY